MEDGNKAESNFLRINITNSMNVETALPESLKTKLAKWMSFFKRDNTVTKMESSFIGVYQQLMEGCQLRVGVEDELQYHEGDVR